MFNLKDLNQVGRNGYGDAVMDYALATQSWYIDYVGEEGVAQDTMRYGGEGAKHFGLIGQKVEREVLLDLAAGYSPDGKKTPLCQNAGAKPQKKVKLDRDGMPRLDAQGNQITKWEGGHQVGYDGTTTAPKSVSFAMAIATPEVRGQIIAAHRHANNLAMEKIASEMETRRGKKGLDVIGVSKAIWVSCDHATERENGFHLHTHNILFSVAEGDDGKWRSFESRSIYPMQKVADSIYQSALAEGLRKIGFGIEQDAKLNPDGTDSGERTWRIAGVSREMEETFSVRQKQILDAMESGMSKQQAWNETRKSKDEPEAGSLFEGWKELVAAHGLDTDIHNYLGRQDVLAPKVSDHQILLALHENNAVVNAEDIRWAVFKARAGQGPREQEETIGRLKDSMYLVAPERQAAVDRGVSVAKKFSVPRYAAEFVVKAENEVIERAEKRKDDQTVRMPQSTLDKIVDRFEKDNGFKLSAEQRTSLDHLCVKSGGHTCLAGVAGSGKTTVAQIYRQAFEANGQTVIGGCMAKSAAQKLEHESGIPSFTTKFLLDKLEKGHWISPTVPKLTSNTVLVIDEAGMADTEEIRKLMRFVDKANAKLLLQGDVSQIPAIRYGSGMSLVMEKLGQAELTEIRRQKDERDLEISEAFYDKDGQGKFVLTNKIDPKSRAEVAAKSEKIFKLLDKRGYIDDFDVRDQAVDALVDDWFKIAAPQEQRLILAHDHADIRAISTRIRSRMRKDGDLQGDEHLVRCTQGMGKTETSFDLSVAIGEKLRITQNNTDLSITNGDIAQVEDVSITKSGSVKLGLRVQAKPGRPSFAVAIDTAEWNHLNHGYVNTIHGAQGQGMDHVLHFGNARMMDSHSGRVAFTRLTSAGNYRMYGETSEIEKIRHRLGKDNFKQNATQEGLWIERARQAKTTARAQAPVVPTQPIEQARQRQRPGLEM